MKIKLVYYLAGFFLLAMLVACNATNNTNKGEHRGSEEADQSEALLLPAIPDEIQDPEKRTEYALYHFWDALDIKNRTQSLDTAFMEQSFSNFTAILPYASEEARQEAVRILVDRSKQDTEVLRLLSWVAYKYLDDPNSPMRSEELYIPFLECFSAGDYRIPEDIRERASLRLMRALKNRPGSKAPDFKVVLRDGNAANLHGLLGKGENIVMFYDSDCEHCREISQRLAGIQLKEGVKIIAVDVAGDRPLWDDKKSSLPAEWTVAYDMDNIEEREIYYLPALPTFYILDSIATILAKDAIL